MLHSSISRAVAAAAKHRRAAAVWTTILASSLLVALPCVAQSPGAFDTEDADVGPIVTDRPTNGSSPHLVPPGHGQIETGFAWEHLDLGDGLEAELIRSLVTSVRVAAAPWAEVQINYAGQIDFELRREDSSIETFGKSDFEIGAKFRLVGSRAAVPAALVVGLTLPTGDDQFSSGEFDPRIAVAMGHAPASWLSFDVNAGVDVYAQDVAEGVLTAAASVVPFAGWSFVYEHTSVTRLDEGSTPANYGLLAATFQPTTRVQIDAGWGWLWSNAAGGLDTFGTLGVALRLPD